jgi:hypothetical protein
LRITATPCTPLNRNAAIGESMQVFREPSSVGQESQAFKSGEECPASGVYRVHHYQHRAPHTVYFLRGQAFPPCRRCQEHIYYRLLMAVKPSQEEADLISS